MNNPLPTTALGQDSHTVPRGQASTWSRAVGRLGGLLSLVKRPPTVWPPCCPSESFQTTTLVQMEVLSGCVPIISPLPPESLHLHRVPDVSTHPVPAQATGPASGARACHTLCTGDRCPRHLHSGLLPGGTSCCMSPRNLVYQDIDPSRSPAAWDRHSLPGPVGAVVCSWATSAVTAFYGLYPGEPLIANTCLPRVGLGAQNSC